MLGLVLSNGCSESPSPPEFTNPLDPGVTGRPALPPPQIEARWGNAQVELRWTVPDTVAPAAYHIYRRRSGEPDVVQLPTTTLTTFLDRGLANRHRYIYTVAAVDSYDLEGERSSAQAVTPLTNYLIIHDYTGDSLRTNSLNVVLEIQAPRDTVANVRISNDPAFSAPPPATMTWVPFTQTYYPWRLEPGGDSLKAVYVQFTDSQGQESVVIVDRISYSP
jgi:hypothetical protein